MMISWIDVCCMEVAHFDKEKEELRLEKSH